MDNMHVVTELLHVELLDNYYLSSILMSAPKRMSE